MLALIPGSMLVLYYCSQGSVVYFENYLRGAWQLIVGYSEAVSVPVHTAALAQRRRRDAYFAPTHSWSLERMAAIDRRARCGGGGGGFRLQKFCSAPRWMAYDDNFF